MSDDSEDYAEIRPIENEPQTGPSSSRSDAGGMSALSSPQLRQDSDNDSINKEKLKPKEEVSISTEAKKAKEEEGAAENNSELTDKLKKNLSGGKEEKGAKEEKSVDKPAESKTDTFAKEWFSKALEKLGGTPTENKGSAPENDNAKTGDQEAGEFKKDLDEAKEAKKQTDQGFDKTKTEAKETKQGLDSTNKIVDEAVSSSKEAEEASKKAMDAKTPKEAREAAKEAREAANKAREAADKAGQIAGSTRAAANGTSNNAQVTTEKADKANDAANKVDKVCESKNLKEAKGPQEARDAANEAKITAQAARKIAEGAQGDAAKAEEAAKKAEDAAKKAEDFAKKAEDSALKIDKTERNKTDKIMDESGKKAADALANQFKSGRMVFNDNMQNQKYNEDFWQKTPDPRNPNRHMWAPKGNASDAVRDSMEGTDFDKDASGKNVPKYGLDCAAATHLASLHQELNTMGDKAFNEKYENLKVNGFNGFEKIYGNPEKFQFGPGNKASDLAGPANTIDKDSTIENPNGPGGKISYVDASKIKDLDQMLRPGDVVHFRNSDRSVPPGGKPAEYTAWQGENAIYKGKDQSGVPQFSCNPGGGKEAFVYTTPDGNKVWAMDVLGTDAAGNKAPPFILSTGICYLDPREQHSRRLGGMD